MQNRRSDHAVAALNVLQLLADMSASFAGFAAAYLLYSRTNVLAGIKRFNPSAQFSDYYLLAGIFCGAVLVTFAVKHLYQTRETGLMNMDEATGVLHGLFIAGMIVVSCSYVFVDPHQTKISRLVVGIGLTLGCFFVLLGRAFVFKIRRYLQSKGYFFRRVIICGAGEAGRTIARKCLHSPKFHILPVAFLSEGNDGDAPASIDCLAGYDRIPVAGKVEDMARCLRELDADEVWIAMPGAAQDAIMDAAERALNAGAACRFVPDLYRIPLETITVDSLGGVPLLSVKPRVTARPTPLSKRVFDIVFSTLVLIASIPMWILAVILIRATSRGPALFKQERVGQGGRSFMMYKFRTMYADADPYAETPRNAADKRITPLGRWLRRLSVDELPQFWNVLRGDMSVVGPRPEMPQIVAEYTPIQRQRLCVKPGITGVWQISADRRNPIHENIDYDLYYIEKQSFFLDLMIILTTGVYGARGV